MATGMLSIVNLVLICLVLLHRRRLKCRKSLVARKMMRRVRLLRRSLILDQQMVCFSAFLLLRFSNACVTRRSAWSKYRSQAFFSIVVSRWTDREWKKNFRVSRITFHFLCRELAPFLTKRHIVRKPLSVDQRVAMCLWRLGTNVEYRTISHLFGVGLSTVCVAVHEVCNVLVEHFRSKYIKIPSGQGLRSVIDGFESKWDFPQCVGAIDGSHIPIIAPKDNPLDYYNRKGYHSVVLQALVDHNYNRTKAGFRPGRWLHRHLNCTI